MNTNGDQPIYLLTIYKKIIETSNKCSYIQIKCLSFYNQFIIYFLLIMQLSSSPTYQLNLRSITWYKDSHSLFDYESTKLARQQFFFKPDTKSVYIFRSKKSKDQPNKHSQVFAFDQRQLNEEKTYMHDFLAKFQVQNKNSGMAVSFVKDNKMQKKKEQQKLLTDQSQQSLSQSQKKDQPYLVVRKLKDNQGMPVGIKLSAGQTIKIGRIQFIITEVCIGTNVTKANQCILKQAMSSRKVMQYSTLARSRYFDGQDKQNKEKSQSQRPQCKICLQEKQDKHNFLFKPCVCKGTCGHVHLQCLAQWIHFKVKKQVVGGTLHYNFQKFICEVCKHDLPMIMDIDGKQKQLLPIQKVSGNYLILQSSCLKEKSLIVIQNVPNQGIKLGRGQQCQIRIADISVSRNHAYVKFQNNQFKIYDNNSKFGTLIKQPEISVKVQKHISGIQIGRTVLSFQKRSYIQPGLKKVMIQRVRNYDRQI